MDWNVLTIWFFFDKTLEDTSDAYQADNNLPSPIMTNLTSKNRSRWLTAALETTKPYFGPEFPDLRVPLESRIDTNFLRPSP